MNLEIHADIQSNYTIESIDCNWSVRDGFLAVMRLAPTHDNVQSGVGFLNHLAQVAGTPIALKGLKVGAAEQTPVDIHGVVSGLTVEDRNGVLALEMIDPLTWASNCTSHAVFADSNLEAVVRTVLGPNVDFEFIDNSGAIDVPLLLVNGVCRRAVCADLCKTFGVVAFWGADRCQVRHLNASSGKKLTMGADASGELAIRLQPLGSTAIMSQKPDSYKKSEADIAAAETCSGLAEVVMKAGRSLAPATFVANHGGRRPWEIGLLDETAARQGLVSFDGSINQLVMPGCAIELACRDGSQAELIVEAVSFNYSSRRGTTGPVRVRAVDPLTLRSRCSIGGAGKQASIAIVDEVLAAECAVAVTLPWDSTDARIRPVALPLLDSGPEQGAWRRPAKGSPVVVSWWGLGEGLCVHHYLPLPELFYGDEDLRAEVDSSRAGIVRAGGNLFIRGPQDGENGAVIRLGESDMALVYNGEEVLRVDSTGLHLQYDKSNLHLEPRALFATGEQDLELSTSAGARVALNGASTRLNDGAIEVD